MNPALLCAFRALWLSLAVALMMATFVISEGMLPDTLISVRPLGSAASRSHLKSEQAHPHRDRGRDARKFSLLIRNAEIGEVLETLAPLADYQLVKSQRVSGRISVSLENVTIPQALKAILSAGGYACQRRGNFLYVSLRDEVRSNSAPRRELAKQSHFVRPPH